MRRLGAVAVVTGLAMVVVGCGPTFPTGATLTVVGRYDLVNIRWPAATDGDAGQTVESYRIDVDGVEVSRVWAPTRSCVLEGLSPGNHVVAVTAYDDAGEWSGGYSNDVGRLGATVSAPSPSPGTVRCLPTGRDDQVSVGNAYSTTTASAVVSDDGRYVAFASDATDLIPNDANGLRDLFYWDSFDRSTRRISTNFNSGEADMSGDGRYVVYRSDASDLVPGDTNGRSDVFIWDQANGSTTRLTNGNSDSWGPSISDDGRYIVFTSGASDLVAGDTNGVSDIFVWDRLGSTSRLVAANGSATISANGGSIAFSSYGMASLPGGVTSRQNVYRWDRSTLTVSLVAAGNGDTYNPVISGNGNTIVFRSYATDLAGGGYFMGATFAWKRATNSYSLVANAIVAQAPSVSDDGRYATYNNGHLYVRDLVSNTSTPVSAGDGMQLIGGLSGNGRYVIYGHPFDVFRWDRLVAP